MLNPRLKVITDFPAEELVAGYEEWKDSLGCDIDVLTTRIVFNFTMGEFHLFITYKEVKDEPE